MAPLADHMRCLNHLAKEYPSLEAVAEAIINLQAQLKLPKAPSILFRTFTANTKPFASW